MDNNPNQADLVAHLTGSSSALAYPAAITEQGGGGKFDHAGTALLHPGNTFICHIDPQSAFYKSLSLLQDAIRALPQAGCMTFLPKPSFHMTVFCGISGSPLGVDGWPDGINQGSTLESISSIWSERFKSIGGGIGGFTVVADQLRTPYSLSMQPASDADSIKLIEARTKLEKLTGLVRGDLHSYQFHVTLAYLVRWLNAEDAVALMAGADRMFEQHMAGNNAVTLGEVEFCTFETMHEFTPVCS